MKKLPCQPSNWADALAVLPMDALASVFPDDGKRRTAAKLGAERSYRHAGRHSTRDALAVSTAAASLERLPAGGETIHVLLSGNFNNADFIPAVVKLASPVTVDALIITTLGYNRVGMMKVLDLLDGGTIGTCTLLASCYFRTNEAELWGWLSAEFARRKCRLLAARSHAKLILFAMADGTRYTMEGSGNLRSCRCHEQTAITNDIGLYDFHAEWVNRLFDEAGHQ
jgi:hypothetical protein